MIPQPITIGGKSGTVMYLDAHWKPVLVAQATMAKVLFDDGSVSFYFTDDKAEKRDYVRDEKGRFAETATGTAIGIIHRGVIRVRDLKGRDPYAAEHRQLWQTDVSAAGRFRYNHGRIEWLDKPDADDYFAVDDYFAKKKWFIKGHYGQTHGDLIPPPVPEGLGGITRKFDAAKHPRGEDGRFIEASAPRIFNRAEEVGRYEGGWGGDPPRWAWRATAEDVRLYGSTLGAPTGRLLTGEPIPREKLPETLYHVTTNAPAVKESGVLLGLLEMGGLGGGQAPGVSFTTSLEDATVIQRELKRAVKIARGTVNEKVFESFAREDEQDARLPKGALDYAVGQAMQAWDGNKHILKGQYVEGKGYDGSVPLTPEEYERIRRSLMKDAFNSYLWARETAAEKAMGQPVPALKNPLLFGDQKQLEKLNPEDIQTLTVASEQIPEGALVTTGSDKFLHEVRAYSDVPVWRRWQSIAKKYAENQARDPAGSPTGGQFTETGRSGEATSTPELAVQAKTGIAEVEKLLPEAVKTADFSQTEVSDWEDGVPEYTKERVEELWKEREYDTVDDNQIDERGLDKLTAEELQEDNQEILDEAVENLVNSKGLQFKDPNPALPIEGEPFQLWRKVDLETLDYGAGTHEEGRRPWLGTVKLDLEALRFEDGSPLTPEEQKTLQEEWDVAYNEAFEAAFEKAKESDKYLNRRGELIQEVVDAAWNRLDDDEKITWMRDQGIKVQTEVGAPRHWVTGVEQGKHGDEDYNKTHAVALRLAELRTDELRKERGLLKPPIEKPTYTIRDESLAPSEGWAGETVFTAVDGTGRIVARMQTKEAAIEMAERWAIAESQKPVNVSTKQLIAQVWESWKQKSSEGFGLSLQLAAAREFNGLHRLSVSEVEDAEEYAEEYGGIETLQAYVRAQWEVTQMVMQKAGENKVQVYRGLMLDGKDLNATTNVPLDKLGGPIKAPSNITVHERRAEPALDTPDKPPLRVDVVFDYNGERLSVMKQKYGTGFENTEVAVQRRIDDYHRSSDLLFTKLPDLPLKRAGAQSTTGTRAVANDWGGVGELPPNPTRVVLRVEAPSTSVLSLPVYGQNMEEEHESVLIGTKDKWLWDAWRLKAPDFRSQPVSDSARKADTKPLVIDLQAEDRGKPHWMSSVDWAKVQEAEKKKAKKDDTDE